MKRASVSSVALLLAASVALAQSQPKASAALDLLFDELAAVRQFAEPQVSPDGRRVAWIAGRDESSIWVQELGSAYAKPMRITAGDGKTEYSERGVAWSPDGARLAFLSDRDKKGQFQLYEAAAGGGRARRLSSVTGYLAAPRWSPDGRNIALLFVENAARIAGPTEAITPLTGVAGEKIDVQRLAVVEVATGMMRQVSPRDLHVHEYDWSPDSASFAAIASTPPGDSNWYTARLYTLALATAAMREILRPSLQIGVPRWSPDGKSIALIGGLMSDEGQIGGEILLVPAAGGAARNLTPGRKSSPSWLAWTGTPAKLLFTEYVFGGAAIATLDPANLQIETLWRGEDGSRGLSLTRDGRTSALVRQSWSQPPEVWAGPPGDWRQVTQQNARHRAAWGEAKNIQWTSDGQRVQGWLLYPRDYEPARRYPMIVSIHGGPASARMPSWPTAALDAALFAHEGYFVLYPNPRGSFGQGAAFTQANVKDFGGGDLRDVLAGVDEVLRTHPVDPNRLGITGWSYGGYMTMWTVTQTTRFRAAVAGAGIANWKSYYGQNSIDQWMIPFFGASVYDDPAVYAKSSPIEFIKQVKTPTLILVGERDGECPVPQSQEFWHALKTLGVKTQLVVYPGEGHGLRQPEHRRDALRRAVGWFNEHLK